MSKPHVFIGLWCQCGARHYQRAAYYVSITSGSQVMLALGPFAEHGDALAQVETVNHYVSDKYKNDPQSPWFGYGTMAMPAGYAVPGKLNPVMGRQP